MKKVLLLIVLIAIAALAYFFYSNRTISPDNELTTPTPPAGEGDTFRPDPSNATFTFDDGPITLSGGRNERPIAPGSAFTEETILLDYFAYGDVNGDGRGDTVALLAKYGAGSGTFVYVAAYVSGPVNYQGSRAIFVGDRIAPQSVSINNGVITVNYLDRDPNEAMAAEPTVPASKQFAFRNNNLQEI